MIPAIDMYLETRLYTRIALVYMKVSYSYSLHTFKPASHVACFYTSHVSMSANASMSRRNLLVRAGLQIESKIKSLQNSAPMINRSSHLPVIVFKTRTVRLSDSGVTSRVSILLTDLITQRMIQPSRDTL